jgi:hypothetical protein
MCGGEHAQFRKPNWPRLGGTSHRRCGFRHRSKMTAASCVRARWGVPHRFESFEPAPSGNGCRVQRRAGEDCGTGSASCRCVGSNRAAPRSRTEVRHVENGVKASARIAVNESSTRISSGHHCIRPNSRIPIAEIRTQSALKVSAAPIRTIPSAGSQRLRALFFCHQGLP